MNGVHKFVHLAETGSTNADALRLAQAGETLPIWVVAERQTSGRGRSGRPWVSDEGNLFASYVLTIEAPMAAAAQLSLVAGVAFYDAVQDCLVQTPQPGLRLKWPNDLLVGPAKVGGILVEAATLVGREANAAVIGFGLNIVSYPDIRDRPVTSLAAIGVSTSVADVLAKLAEKCDRWIETWDCARGFEQIRQAWTSRAGPIGEMITVHLGTSRVRGTYQGLSESGALLADVDGRRETINVGDVVLG